MGRKTRKTKTYKNLIVSIGMIISAAIALLVFVTKNKNTDATLDISTFEPSATQNSQQLQGSLEVYAIDVGQGDSFLLISPAGKTMLIDAGESEYAEEVVSFLHDKGVERLDVVVATHPHTDHIGAMEDILAEFNADRILLPSVEYPTKTYSRLLEMVDEKDVKRCYVWSGDTVEWDPACNITILSPVYGGEYSSADMNEWSIILRAEFGNTSMLFTGDAESHSEQLAMFSNEAWLFDVDVLKVGHHGSDTSSTSGFLEAVSPEYAIISAGEGNQYGHPTEEVLEKLALVGAEVYRTDILGSIEIVLDGTDVSIKPCE